MARGSSRGRSSSPSPPTGGETLPPPERGRRGPAGESPSLRRHHRPDVLRGVREQCHEASPLEGGREHALMLRAVAALAAGGRLRAGAEEALEAGGGRGGA